MVEWYEVLKEKFVKDSDGHFYEIGDRIELDETRLVALLDTILNYQADGALSEVRQGFRPTPFPIKVAPAKPATP